MSSLRKVAVAKDSDLKEGQKKAFKFGNDDEIKVLVAKVNGKVYATAPKCSHYGAPLENGVLSVSSDGQRITVTCPWHSACFSLKGAGATGCAGDIEDAPAPDPIQAFNASIEDGQIFVEANETIIKANVRKPSRKVKEQSNGKTVVIVGGGAGGFATAEGLVEGGWNGKVVVLSKENYLPVDRTKLSKALIGDPSKIALRTESLSKDLGIDYRLDTIVSSVNSNKKTVSTSKGETISYDKLVLATGGTPKPLPIPGHDLKGIFLLRSVNDAQAINQAIGDKKPNIVIVGSSFIGMELATPLVSMGTVTVLTMDEQPFEKILGKDIGKVFKKLHEDKGVKFQMQAQLQEFVGKKDDPSSVGGVKLKSGDVVPADYVICGTGVGPETGYLNKEEWKLEKDGSIKVDDFMRVIGVPDVYAIGDIANFHESFCGLQTRIEHWNIAQNHGRTAAANIIKGNTEPFAKVPFFWSAQQGKQMRYAGHAEGWDDIIYHGKLDELTFAAYFAKDNKVMAVATVGYDPTAVHCLELMRRGKMPPANEIKNGLWVKNELKRTLSNFQ